MLNYFPFTVKIITQNVVKNKFTRTLLKQY